MYKSMMVVLSILVTGALVFVFIFKVVAPHLQNSEADCSTTGVNHQAIVLNNKVSPQHTYAKVCDTLTIINQDDANRLMAFGIHDHHIAYDRVTEKELRKGNQLTVTLNKTGTYTFHDHLQDEALGEFSVSK